MRNLSEYLLYKFPRISYLLSPEENIQVNNHTNIADPRGGDYIKVYPGNYTPSNMSEKE